jgi:hypothetical protein
VGKNGIPPELFDPFGLVQNGVFDVVNGLTSHGSICNPDDEHDGDDEEAAVLHRDVTGKLDIGKSGLIFNVFTSAFSCRRHLARRF